MRKLIYIIVILGFGLQGYSQIKEKRLTASERKILIDSLSSLPLKPTEISFSGEVFIQSNSSRSVNDGCSGGDFEIPPITFSGFPNVQIISQEWMFQDLINTGGSPLGSGLYVNGNPVSINLNANNSDDNTEGLTWISWTSTGFRDQNLASASPPYTLVEAVSGRGLRLGNIASTEDFKPARAEAIYKTFTVTNTNKIYYFKYAVVGQRSHENDNSGFFLAEARDISGNIIDSYSEIGNQSNPFVTMTRNDNNRFLGRDNDVYPEYRYYFRDWTCASLDLRAYIGQQVTVRFINADCAYGAHTSHTYLDDICIPCKDTEGYIELENFPQECKKLPYTINGSFTLPANQPNIRNVQIKINLYQNNVLKHSFTPIISGTNYSLMLTSAMVDEEDCFDVVSVLEFELPDGYQPNKFRKYTKYSSEPLNNNIEGQVDGLNNDICFCSNPPPNVNCCVNKLEFQQKRVSQTNIPNDVGWNFGVPVSLTEEEFTITNPSLIPITQLRAVVTDFNFNYELDACASCINNPALWASIDNANTDNIGDINTGLILKDYLGSILKDKINQREVIWENKNGSMLRAGDKFNLAFVLPPFSEIPCCATSVQICFDISYKDANCKICTEPFCTTINLIPTSKK